MLLYLSSMPVL